MPKFIYKSSKFVGGGQRLPIGLVFTIDLFISKFIKTCNRGKYYLKPTYISQSLKA